LTPIAAAASLLRAADGSDLDRVDRGIDRHAKSLRRAKDSNTIKGIESHARE
jgi:hypothetical protein